MKGYIVEKPKKICKLIMAWDGMKTYSPVTVSYKSVKAKFVLVLPSQVAMVETKRSRRDGVEVAAT